MKTLTEFSYKLTGKIVAPPAGSSKANTFPTVFLNGLLRVMKLGYTLSEELYSAIYKASTKDMVESLYSLETTLRKNLGLNPENGSEDAPHFVFRDFIKNDYLLKGPDAFTKYVQDLEYEGMLPIDSEKLIAPQKLKDLKPVNATSKEELDLAVSELLSTELPLSKEGNMLIKWAMTNYPEIEKLIPSKISSKETLAVVYEYAPDNIKSALKLTTKDILRIAYALNGGPSKRFTFKSKTHRKMLIRLIENRANLEDMAADAEAWKVLLHRLGTSSKYPKTLKMAKALRSGQAKTWNAKVSKLLSINLISGLKKLKTKPGQFARMLDNLIRSSKDQATINYIIDSFEDVADKVSEKVLVELLVHLSNRPSEHQPTRTTILKGKTVPIKDTPAISEDNILALIDVVKRALRSIYESEGLEPKDIDESYKKVTAIKPDRHGESSIKAVYRGARRPIKQAEADRLRAYLHWFNDEKPGMQYDLDLSVVLITEDFDNMQTKSVSWDKINQLEGVYAFSGDVTSRPGSCAEYIDIHIPNMLNHGYRYAMLLVSDFPKNELGISQYGACVGFMSIPRLVEGDVQFSPKNMEHSISLNTESTTSAVCLLDLKTREYLPVEVTFKANTVSSIETAITGLCKTITTLGRVSQYDLLSLKHSPAQEVQYA